MYFCQLINLFRWILHFSKKIKHSTWIMYHYHYITVNIKAKFKAYNFCFLICIHETLSNLYLLYKTKNLFLYICLVNVWLLLIFEVLNQWLLFRNCTSSKNCFWFTFVASGTLTGNTAFDFDNRVTEFF